MKSSDEPAAASPGTGSHTYTLKLANGNTKNIIRKKRVPLKSHQKEALEHIFQSKSLPKGKEGQEFMKSTADDLGLGYQQVRKWFDNRVQKQNLHEARALAILSGEASAVQSNPRAGYKKRDSLGGAGGSAHKKSKMDDGEASSSKGKKTPAKAHRMSMSDSKSKHLVSGGSDGVQVVNPEIVQSMKAVNEFFNFTDVEDIIVNEKRDEVFEFIMTTIKGKRTGSLFTVMTKILKIGNPAFFTAIQTLFANGGYDDLCTRVLHETVSMKTNLVWHAMCIFQHRQVNSCLRSSALLADTCIDAYKTIKRLVGHLLPEYSAKVPVGRGKVDDDAYTLASTNGGASDKKSPRAKKKTPIKKDTGKKKTPAKKVVPVRKDTKAIV
jgi:hypothetical protein|eukprot:Stramenopile-MAST_4_protein_3540